MPTTYTHAHRFDATGDQGLAAANALYNNLAALSVGLLLRYDNTADGYLWSKGDSSAGLAAVSIGNDGRADFRAERATGAGFFRESAITVDNIWRWIFFTFNRTAVTTTRLLGPKGGTLTSVTPSDGGGGSGLVAADAAYPFTIGSNGLNPAIRNAEFAFAGFWNVQLTLAQAQAIADDLSTALQPIAAWKPDAGSAASIANYIIADPVLPAMTMTGTTLVGGPDSSGGALSAAALRQRRRMACSSSFF